MKICGIDDAGRGSMIGPLVIAGISIKKQNLKKLISNLILKILICPFLLSFQKYGKIIFLVHSQVNSIWVAPQKKQIFGHTISHQLFKEFRP